MVEKYTQLFSPDGMLYSAGAPVLISQSALELCKRSKKKVVRMTLKNISQKTIKAVMVTVTALDKDGVGRWGEVVCLADALSVPRDGEFFQDRIFDMPDGETCSFTVSLGEVDFEDESVWTGDNKAWSVVSRPVSLSQGLGSDELATQYKIRYGADCCSMPKSESELWFCACGGINRSGEQNCHLCRRTYAALKAVNLGSLKSELAERMLTEQQKNDEEAQIKHQRKKKTLRRWLFIGPVAVLLALVIAVLPGFIADKKAYNTAAAMLSAGMYDEASAAFTELGLYGDSREQAEKNVPYQKALYLLSCADGGDSPGLTLLGLRRSDFEDEEHMRIALYEGAAELFTSLDGYKNSTAKLIYAQDTAAELQNDIYRADYEVATALLADRHYRQAQEVFISLGDFSDSAEMAKECMYQKGTALLNFVEQYTVRDVSADISAPVDMPNRFHFSKAAFTRLGEGSTVFLRSLMDPDVTEISIGDDDTEGLSPLCPAIVQMFTELGDFKDSQELAARAEAAGDFTKPFYDFCAQGKLSAAISWLSAYDGEFDGREDWLNTLKLYLPYCGSWELHSGDTTLIPLTVGAEGACGHFDSVVIPNAESFTLRLSFNDGQYVDLTAERGDTTFTYSPYENTIYYAGFNNQKRFTYIRYNGQGVIVSSCEYSPK